MALAILPNSFPNDERMSHLPYDEYSAARASARCIDSCIDLHIPTLVLSICAHKSLDQHTPLLCARTTHRCPARGNCSHRKTSLQTGKPSISQNPPYWNSVSIPLITLSLSHTYTLASPTPSVVDSHCHPTDLPFSDAQVKNVGLGGLSAMATRIHDQELVEGFGRDHGLSQGRVGDSSTTEAIACFGELFGNCKCDRELTCSRIPSLVLSPSQRRPRRYAHRQVRALRIHLHTTRRETRENSVVPANVIGHHP